MSKYNLILKIGKRRFLAIDLLDSISEELGMSRSEAKRLIEGGALSFYIDEELIEKVKHEKT